MFLKQKAHSSVIKRLSKYKILKSLEATDLEIDDFLIGLKQDFLSYNKEEEE